MLGRSRFRDRGRGSGVGGSNLLNQATIYLGGVAPFHWLDFINNRALYAGADVGNVTGATGYSFTRASQGYYTNSDGTLTLFGYNLLTWSEDFSNAAWTKSGSTITANATAAPDGTTTADTLIEDGTTAPHYASATVTTTAAAHTLSVYAKPAGRSWVYIRIADSGNIARVVWFDVTNGVVGATGGGITASIQSAGNGWYRCVATIGTAFAGAQTPRIGVASADSVETYTGNGTSGLFIWGAQLEPSASLGSYVPTTTSAAGALRRGDRGVLIEGSRTNLCLRSQEFNSGWTLQNVTIGADATAAPDGTTTADKLTEDSATSGHACFRNVTIAGSVAQAFSVFAKAAERSIIWIAAYDGDGATARVAWFNLATGAVGTVQAGATATIQALANGWYRCTIVRTNSSALTAGIIQIGVTTTDNVSSYAGTTGSGAFIWGAQVETASFASSYIPTTSASVTRAADVLTYTAGVTYGLSLWAEFERAVDTGGETILFQVDDGGGLNESSRILITGGDEIYGQVIDGGAEAGVSQVTGVLSVGPRYKSALRSATNSVRAAQGGTLGGSDTSVVLPNTPTIMRVGTAGASPNAFAYFSRLAVFNSALTDAQLQTVST